MIMLLNDFKRNLFQDTSLILNGCGLTTAPILLTINDDQGIFDAMFMVNQNDYDVFRLSKSNPELYLLALASRILGVGICVASYQKSAGEGANEFSDEDMRNLKKEFNSMDTYKLGLTTLEIGPASKKKDSIDKAMIMILDRAKMMYPNLDKDLIFLKEYLRIVYYAGITLGTYK